MSDVDEGNNPPPESNKVAAKVAEEKQAEDTQPEGDAESFLEREIERRQQSLKLYLALLAIPVALGIVVLIFGRSDRQMVTDEINNKSANIVARELETQIQPNINQAVENINAAVEKRFSPTLTKIDNLNARQDEIQKTTGSLNASQQQLTTKLKSETDSLRNEISGVNSNINLKLSEVTKTTNKKIEDINTEFGKLRKEVDELKRQLNLRQKGPQ